MDTLPDARETDAAAAQWLQRRHFWDWTEKDQADLDTWLDQSFAHRAAYLRLSDVWLRTGRLVALRPPFPPQHRRIAPLFQAVAGLAAIAVVSFFAFRTPGAPPDQRYMTSIGGRESILLADGTKIELNTDTVLRVSGRAGERLVWLDKGEAFFQVRHDANHPFVVHSADHQITDLGTKFLVRGEAGILKVSLVEGRARVDGPGNKYAILVPGDVAIATESKLAVTQKPETALDRSSSWRRGVLVFDNTSLSEAVAEFNRYNRTKLIISDAETGSRKIYGTFPTTDVDAFSRLARAVFGLKVERRGDQTVISR